MPLGVLGVGVAAVMGGWRAALLTSALRLPGDGDAVITIAVRWPGELSVWTLTTYWCEGLPGCTSGSDSGGGGGGGGDGGGGDGGGGSFAKTCTPKCSAGALGRTKRELALGGRYLLHLHTATTACKAVKVVLPCNAGNLFDPCKSVPHGP